VQPYLSTMPGRARLSARHRRTALGTDDLITRLTSLVSHLVPTLRAHALAARTRGFAATHTARATAAAPPCSLPSSHVDLLADLLQSALYFFQLPTQHLGLFLQTAEFVLLVLAFGQQIAMAVPLALGAWRGALELAAQVALH